MTRNLSGYRRLRKESFFGTLVGIPRLSRGTLGDHMALRPCRECGEEISSTATSCPRCGKSSPHGTSAIVRYGGGVLGALFGLGVAASVLLPGKQSATPVTPALAAAPPPAAPPPQPRQPDGAALANEVLRVESFEGAVRRVRPLLGDGVGDINTGAALLGMWFAKHGRLADVAVKTDETTVRKAKKDIDAARGKRLCVRGQVVQIEREKVGAISMWTGNLMTGSMDVVNFIAGGSTGELVQNSYARLCGIVTGEYAYQNLSGGQTRSIQTVGMFDLPENRR